VSTSEKLEIGNTGIIYEFLRPQFANGFLPNREILYGFGQDFYGELYALTQASGVAPGGSGGTIYRIAAVPEPSTVVLFLGAAGGVFIARRRIFPRRFLN